MVQAGDGQETIMARFATATRYARDSFKLKAGSFKDAEIVTGYSVTYTWGDIAGVVSHFGSREAAEQFARSQKAAMLQEVRETRRVFVPA